ncbi:MAG: hypothetical protein Q7R94_00120 [bacterium]|nr:hypothetical protein [bacterium]
MATSKTILIVIAIAGMIGAVIFFAFLVKRPVGDSQPEGLPVTPPLSFPGTSPVSPGAETLPRPGGEEIAAGVPTNAFLPVKQAPSQASANAFLPLSSFGQGSPLVLSKTEESSLSELINQLNLRDESGNLLSPQQLFGGQNDLPLPIQQLLQKPGGATIADILMMEEKIKVQADSLAEKMNQLQGLSQSGDLVSATELCKDVIADLKSFYSSWGSGTVPSALEQATNCGSELGGQLPTQLPFGFPSL